MGGTEYANIRSGNMRKICLGRAVDSGKTSQTSTSDSISSLDVHFFSIFRSSFACPDLRDNMALDIPGAMAVVLLECVTRCLRRFGLPSIRCLLQRYPSFGVHPCRGPCHFSVHSLCPMCRPQRCSVIDMACILNWTTKTEFWGSYTSWNFSCATISAVFCLIFLLLNKFAGDMAQKIQPILCVFLAIW